MLSERKEHRCTHYNARVRVRSSAPTRLDLAGGTLDIWPLYLFHENAQTLNAALTIRAECVLSDPTTEEGPGLHIVSEDTGASLSVPHWSALTGEEQPRLVARLLRYFQPEQVSVVTRSQSPVGAGLAGSSALNIALCAALAAWQHQSYSPEVLIDLAQNLEAQVIKVPTGAQDYRPAVYGGLASIELGPDGVHRSPLSVDTRELDRRLVVAYTGDSRNSGINNWEITKRHLDGDQRVIDCFGQIRDIAVAMRSALEAQDWPEVGRQLADEWAVRKRLAPTVSTPTIDALVDRATNAGALAAKVCGAGGGGCMLFFAAPATVPAVREAVASGGARLLDARIDTEGLHVDRD